MESEAFITVNIKIVVFCGVMPFSLVGRYYLEETLSPLSG